MSFSITDTFEGPIKKHIDTGLLQTGTAERTIFCVNDNIYMSRDGALIDMKNKKILHNFNCHIRDRGTHEPFNYYNNIEKNSTNHWAYYRLSSNSVTKNSQNFLEYYSSHIVIQNKNNIYVFDNFNWNNQTSIPYHKLQLNQHNELKIIKSHIKLDRSLDSDSIRIRNTIVIININYNIIIISDKVSTVLYSLETSEQIIEFQNYFLEQNSYGNKVPYHLLLLNNTKENKGILYNLATQKLEIVVDSYINFSNKYSYFTNDNFYDCIKTSNKTYMFSIDNQPPKKTDAQEAKELREKIEFLEKNSQRITNENTKLKKQNKKLQTQLDSITQEKTEIQADLQHAEQEIEEYTTQLNEAEEAKKSLEWMSDDYFNQSNQINQLKLTIDKLQKEHTTEKPELLQTIEEQSQNIRKHEVLNTELLKTIDEHEKAFNLLEKEKECIDLLKSEYFDELTQSRNTIIDLQKEIDSLKAELNKKWF